MSQRILHSRNITISNSPGFVRRDDPSYTSLPPDSRKPPAPVDPSSELSFFEFSFIDLVILPEHPVSKWFYISSAQV